TLGILAVDWARFLGRFPARRVPPVFADMAPPPGGAVAMPDGPATAPDGAPSLRALLAADADPPVRLLAHVRATAAGILGLPAGTLPDPDAPLRELGLDSLMTIELRNALAGACETRLSATLVFEHPTCAALAAHLGAAVFGFPAAAPADDLDALDADALARLLEQELGAADAELARAP
ncbi:MAG: acyl carrier protein, partial [Rhodospirillales bacterium]|nr:acyl carrier protein [Rhodospirillales bacterium]